MNPEDLPLEYLDAVRESAAMYGIPESILFSLISQESNWDPQAGSPVGAYGLTQLMPDTVAELDPRGAERYGIESLLRDPVQQIRMGAQYLGSLYDRFGSWPEALGAYNSGAGGGRDETTGEDRPPRGGYFDESGDRQRVFDTAETQNYVLDILERARGPEEEMFVHRGSPDRSREERRRLIEERYYAVPGASYDFLTDSYVPIRPQANPRR